MSAIQESSVPSLTDPAQWPDLVVTLASLCQSDGSPNTEVEIEQDHRNAVFKELADRNRMLNASGKYETVLCADFFEEHPPAARNNLWAMIKITPHLCWVLKGSDPTSMVNKLPGNWGIDGYSNVCIADALDGALDLNRERILALSRVPARHRALWINQDTCFPEFNRSDTGIDWVIPDTTTLSDTLASSQVTAGECVPLSERPVR